MGTKSTFPQRSPSGYHVTSSPRKARVQAQHVLGVGFGLQKDPNLCGSPRLHTDSNWDVLILVGKLIKSTFQRIQSHIHISSESGAALVLLSKPFWLRCCVTLFWANGPCIKLGPLGTRPRVRERP